MRKRTQKQSNILSLLREGTNANVQKMCAVFRIISTGGIYSIPGTSISIHSTWHCTSTDFYPHKQIHINKYYYRYCSWSFDTNLNKINAQQAQRHGLVTLLCLWIKAKDLIYSHI